MAASAPGATCPSASDRLGGGFIPNPPPRFYQPNSFQ